MKISDEIKTNFKDNSHMAIVNVMYTANWLRDLNKEILKEDKLLPQHYNVLRIVNGRHPEPTCPGDIKKVMLDKGPDITRLIDKLVNMGLLDRCLNAENRRSMDITISEHGQTILKKLTIKMDKVRQKHFGLTEDESLQLSELLDKARR
ncbi:MarR family winged helix-turn-helix transcriptional regulator [Reichenbachiella sp. MSK19-1]|uniref:MarR family winged helix-turn-helix transcriptional regulator n=1 Tax=Reichenbachiella sp. MSK19-1 TaxID=1897631 RepID=UPI000E6CCED3|nr:MarR family transcriptional regulator [Reichenbachiella sp. MSK19-1]RJE71675.1 hypothetical protein BGP76_06195 [Reichenbachiella sp. MSK19-1]